MPTENIDWVLELDSESDMELEIDRPLIRGTDDYNELVNRPFINDVEILGHKSIPEILNGQWLVMNGMTSEERIGAET